MDDVSERAISVLLLPWLAHGHVSPYLELAKRLAERKFRIYLCSTPVNLSSIKDSITDEYSDSIQIVELHLPSLPELPPRFHTTNGLPPHLLNTLVNAFEMASPAFSKILETHKPDLVVYDFNQPWAASIASSHNIPAVLFLIFGAAVTAFCRHMMTNFGKPFPFPEIFYRKQETMRIEKALGSAVAKPKDRFVFVESIKRADLVVMKTFNEIEDKYLNYLSASSDKKMIPTGPLVRDSVNEEEKSMILDWLDEKEKGSTVFVAFGTEYALLREEILEVAHGLELSNAQFVWVLKFTKGEKITLAEALPEGFLDRVKERGVVVEGWAPQARILQHPSVGGFVSHCGWSSAVESMKFGVPIVAMPMHFEQPLNTRIIEEVGCGVEVARDEEDGKLRREVVAEAIRRVLMDPDGEDLRKKARELGEIIRKKDDGEVDGLAEELRRLCCCKKRS